MQGFLTTAQRLQRLRVRLVELACWRDANRLEIDGWTIDGAPIPVGGRWPDRIGVKHLRHDAVQVPADWPLEQVRLHLSLGGEGLVEVVYDEGESEGFGLDPNHRRYPLHAREFAIDAEVVGRLPFGQPVRDPHLEAAALVVEEPDLSRLLALLTAVQSAAGALLEEEVVDPLLGAAEHALTLLDWPSDTLPYVARTAGTPQQQAIWELPADLPSSPAPLDEHARASVRAAIADLEKGLAKLRERYPKHGRVLLSGHAHLDLAWLWPLAETRRKARRTSSTVLALLDRYPEFVFNQSSAQVYAYLEEDDPELWAAVKQEVEGGRWEPVGGMWIEPDCNLPSGEALARQLLYGQRYFKRAFGHRHRVAWLPDCFGFTGGLPQLLRQAGITGFFTIKVNWSETNHFPYDLFWWEGIDGTRVLAHTFENPGGGYNGDASPASFVGTWDNYRGKHVHPESLLSVGFGDGAGGPTREMMASVDVSEQLPVVPAASFGLVEELFQRFGEAAERSSLPVWVGNLYLELHRGTLTTQGRTKLLHRRGERTLLAAEALGSLAALAGASLPPSLEPAWRILLRNEFHDILPGSGIREVYQDAEAELSQVVELAEAARATAVDAIAGQLATDGGAPAVVALNPELSPRPVRVQLGEGVLGAQPVEGGYVLSSADEVPGLGARVLLDAASTPGLEVDEHRLENASISVELAADGSLASVYDKRAGREVLDGPGNQLWAYVDKPRSWDAWDVDAGFQDQGEQVTDVASLQVVERGPHRAAIRILRRFRHSLITQDLRLWANSARLDIATRVNWHDRRWLLKARFPLAVRAPFASFETAFGVEQRSTHRNTSWEGARFEVPGHRFVDLSEPDYGAALLNDGKYGHDVLGSEIGLSLLRSPIYPDPLADEGEQSFTYALCPHQGDWLEGGVLSEAEDLNQPLQARVVAASEARTWQPLRLDGLPLGLGALKTLEDGGGLVLRCYEPRGSRGAVTPVLPRGWRIDGELNLLEDRIGEAETAFRPFQVRSWRLVPEGGTG